jgi:hypothetical protein
MPSVQNVKSCALAKHKIALLKGIIHLTRHSIIDIRWAGIAQSVQRLVTGRTVLVNSKSLVLITLSKNLLKIQSSKAARNVRETHAK